MPKINFFAEETFTELLDSVCKTIGVSRSEFIRSAILEKLQGYSVVSTKIKNTLQKALEVVWCELTKRSKKMWVEYG